MARKYQRKGRKLPRVEVDWAAIQADYVTSPALSLVELARRHGVARCRLSDRSTRENWQEQRAQHIAEVVALARQKTASDLAERGVKAFQELLDQMAQVRQAALQALVKDLQTPPEELRKSDEVVSKVKHDPTSKETTTVTVRRRRALGDYRLAEVVLKNEIDLWRTFFGLGHAPAEAAAAPGGEDDAGPTIVIS